ncbi:Flp1 family type IVb pilin [Clostridium sp. Marseille-P3244]|uniref:Flp1 family type IVb pilin n=1 Tax=Clostridium sp. Marseille-P3244 TaxID=1871020 RepID=UPI0009FA1B88|nr:Flp1 family type IVb pilin [Clostridium sp. Marseille-P3244]
MKTVKIWIRQKTLKAGAGKKKFPGGHREVSGITVIELVLILVIIIALLLIFKSQLIDLINTIFDKITSESAGI